MADADPNTPNPCAESATPRRTFRPEELSPFVTDLLHATAVLSMLDHDQLSNVDGPAALDWLASFAHARAHELNGFLDGHQPLYLTDYDGGKRRDMLAALPSYSQYLERLQAPIG